MHLSALIPLFVAIISTISVLAEYSEKCGDGDIRIRKEWRDLSDSEKKAYVKALKCLDSQPHTSKLKPSGATPGIPPMSAGVSHYDDFVYAHMDSNIKDHFTAIFFPWHRWFLHTFEEALKKECGYKGTLPFWDWSRDAANVKASPVFNGSTTYGLGSLGKEANGYNVTDGVFGNKLRPYSTPHITKRNFTYYPFHQKPFPFDFANPNMSANTTFTPDAVRKVVDGSKGNFTDFAYKIDGKRAQGMHNAAHLMMGGDLSNPLFSPNDPLFYLHHANLDCIWARWQKRRKANENAFSGGLTQDLANYDRYPVGAPPEASLDSDLPMVGLSDPVKVKDVMNTKNKYLCYRCDDKYYD